MNSGEKVGSKIINGSYNANDLSTNSITYGYSVANAPSTVGAHSFTVLNLDTTNPDYKMQLGFDGDTNEMFSRIKSNGNWTDWSKYATSLQLRNMVTTDTDQNVTGTKSYINSSGNSSLYNNKLHVKGTNGSKAGISFWSNDVGQLLYWDTGFHFKNQFDSAYQFAKASAFIKDGSDNSYVLLGGGGHKPVSEFVSSADFSVVHKFDQSGGINNGSDTRSNKSWFDYNWAGTGMAGSVINFSGLTGNYNVELFAHYGSSSTIGFRTKNGDTGYWGNPQLFWHNGNFNPDSKISTSHPANGITQNYLNGWLTYYGYTDTRKLSPDLIKVGKLQFGFTSWNNDGGNTSLWADFLHFGGYSDASGGNQNLIAFSKNGFGLRQWQGSFQSPAAYQSFVDYWHTGNVNPVRINSGNIIYLAWTNSNELSLQVDNNVIGNLWHTGNIEDYHQYGLGRINANILTDLNTYSASKTGFYSINLSSNSPYSYGTVIKVMRAAEEGTEIATSVWGDGLSFRGYVGSSYTPWREVWHSGNLNPVTLDTPQTIVHQKTFNQGIGLSSGQKINLAGYGDPAHYIKRFDDDTDGFGISTGFAVKPYNDSSKNLLLVDGSGTYVNGNRVWDVGNFNPGWKAERENNAVGIGFEGGNIENPYMKHNAGAAYLATKNWITSSFIPKTHPVAGIGQSQINGWNNSISQSSASEEVILEDDILTIQPDEFSLKGSGSYDVGSRKKLVHVLFREGKEVNIRELVRRQTMVVFNFSKDPVSLNIQGLKSYALSPGMQVTLYTSDQGEVLIYNETGFKKLQ
ncbi:hypothetical protein CHA01nite_14430 [Chryseobacterium hagamense]|uniref:Uncharacterized protein n=2 Tax=Chryseobacterium hagamense TaxID=395935 RepID=A0A511YKJ5_9FLAO|nr:hypothetical protein CHA01nite_14430 [Chryseobacterium hagamense]